MGTTDISLQRLFQQLAEGNLGNAISETRTYLAAWPNPQTSERFEVLKKDYLLMQDYWMKRIKDPQLDKQYLSLLQRLYVLCANISIHRHMTASSYLQQLYNGVRRNGQPWSLDDIRKQLEDFVSETAMLELEPEHIRQEKRTTLYKQHQERMNALFNFVMTSHIWTDNVAQKMGQILLSPTIDSNDQQLITSAVTLSLMNRFDMAKFRMLTDIYQQAEDEQVRQRALVGWVLSIDDDWLKVYPETQEIVARLTEDKRICKELTELQIQFVYTLNAEKDTSVIQQEIMPDLMKNNSWRISPNGIEEVEDDPLEDVLHPDAAEQRMEQLESSVKRMIDMQRGGADVYFGGFAQMKRSPFFYDTSNWFVPFYLHHPDIRQFVEKTDNSQTLERILQHIPFCNSDKYSFLIAYQQVVNQLPANIREMLRRGEAAWNDHEFQTEQTPAFIRRSYLMDLYRFFRLFPNRTALCNPFDTQKNELGMCLFFASQLFAGTPLELHKTEIVAMLKKQKRNRSAELLLDTFPESMHDVQYYLWRKDYQQVLSLDGDNEKALVGYARQLFEDGRYQEAEELYERLLLLFPAKPRYMLNKAVTLLNMEEYDEALKLLYQLNFEQPEDVNVLRVLAWALTCNGQLEQAENIFSKMDWGENAKASDLSNHGYCLWLRGEIPTAIATFSNAVSLLQDKELFALDREWLRRRGISDTDIKMMESAIGLMSH